MAFDFHEACKNMKYENLELLMKQAQPIVDKFGYSPFGFLFFNAQADSSPPFSLASYFLADATGQILTSQQGVARTNCIDCLDRTNVIQVHCIYAFMDHPSCLFEKSMFARTMLQQQLEQLGILSCRNLQEFPDLDFMFKNIWADNADFMSKQYTGM